ncbi:MAG: tyrosine-type recombinase/integrase [Terracidiphilus sp.]
MALTALKIGTVKPHANKTQRLFDGRGLYLEIAPSGGKWWRFKYRISGKEKRLSLGVFTAAGSKAVEVSLEVARKAAEEARQLLRDGVDPSQERKAEKLRAAHQSETTFEAVAREWHRKQSTAWVPAHAERVFRRMERYIFPSLGQRPIAEIEAPELLSALRVIEARGKDTTTHLARQYVGMVFRYGIATGRSQRNPAADLRGALTPVKKGNFAAVTEPEQLAKILRALDSYEGTLTVRCALRLAPLLVVRPGELRKAEWKDIDLDKAEWRFVASKTNPNHLVPLSKQAMAILREVQAFTGDGRFVFPSARSAQRPMSDAAVLAAMRRMEIPADEMTGHGFRATFRTIGAEVLKFRVDLMEHQLAHAVKDANGTAYNRTSFLPERKRMMQRWADYLDQLKTGEAANVIVGKFGGGAA